jgi:MFS family permease
LALPAIQADLGSSLTELQWTIDAYTLVLASLLMLAGSTADRFGRRKIFQIGLVTFGAGSLLCSVAPNTATLIGFRMVQAVGGSMLNPVAMSIITNVFTGRAERAKAIGIWGGVVGLSFALGPVIGGILVGGIGWRSIFWINVPVAIAAVILTFRFVPESRAPRPRRFDPACPPPRPGWPPRSRPPAVRSVRLLASPCSDPWLSPGSSGRSTPASPRPVGLPGSSSPSAECWSSRWG